MPLNQKLLGLGWRQDNHETGPPTPPHPWHNEDLSSMLRAQNQDASLGQGWGGVEAEERTEDEAVRSS